MLKVRKKKGNIVTAYRLGEHSEVIDELIREGKIKERPDGTFEVFSREAVNGCGEIASPGDYIKIDSAHMPYPNSAEFFLSNHIQTGENTYEQIPRILDAWTIQEPMSEEIRFLFEEEQIMINEEDPDRYFNAQLWGAPLSAAKDAVIILYSITRDEDDKIQDISFNFVARAEFEKTYDIIG